MVNLAKRSVRRDSFSHCRSPEGCSSVMVSTPSTFSCPATTFSRQPVEGKFTLRDRLYHLQLTWTDGHNHGFCAKSDAPAITVSPAAGEADFMEEELS